MNNERGAILLISLWVLLLLTLIGIMALRTTQTELLIAGNHKIITQAFYQAESAVNVARADMDNIWAVWKDEADNAQWDWAVDGFEKTFSIENGDYPGLNNLFSFEFTVRLKAGVGSDGYPAPVLWNGVSENTDGDGFPIVFITGTGYAPHKDHPRKATQVVEIMLRKNPAFTKPDVALHVGDCFTNNGSPQAMIGEGKPGNQTCSADDVHTTSSAGEDCSATDANIKFCFDAAGNETADPLLCTDDDGNVCGTSMSDDGDFYTADECLTMYDSRKDNQSDYNVGLVVKRLLHWSDGVEIHNSESGTFGSYNVNNNADFTVHWHDGGDITINNLNGFGILVVNGNLTLGGNVNWDGMIFVDGDLTISGTGNDVIYGSVMVSGNVTTNGNPAIYYDCVHMDNWLKDFSIWTQMWWRQL